MEFFLLWVFVSIEKIAAFLAIGGGLFKWSLIAYFLTYIVGFAMSKDKEDMQSYNNKMKKHRAIAVSLAVVGAILFTTSSLLPTKKELAIIVAGGATYNVLTSDSAKEIGGKAVELLKKQIDDALKDETINTLKKEAVEQTKEAIKGAVNA